MDLDPSQKVTMYGEFSPKNNYMHKNGMFYALICINNHIIACINYVLSMVRFIDGPRIDFIWSASQSYFHYSFIFIKMNFYSLSCS